MSANTRGSLLTLSFLTFLGYFLYFYNCLQIPLFNTNICAGCGTVAERSWFASFEKDLGNLEWWLWCWNFSRRWKDCKADVVALHPHNFPLIRFIWIFVCCSDLTLALVNFQVLSNLNTSPPDSRFYSTSAAFSARLALFDLFASFCETSPQLLPVHLFIFLSLFCLLSLPPYLIPSSLLCAVCFCSLGWSKLCSAYPGLAICVYVWFSAECKNLLVRIWNSSETQTNKVGSWPINQCIVSILHILWASKSVSGCLSLLSVSLPYLTAVYYSSLHFLPRFSLAFYSCNSFLLWDTTLYYRPLWLVMVISLLLPLASFAAVNLMTWLHIKRT